MTKNEKFMLIAAKAALVDQVGKVDDIDILAITLITLGKKISTKRMLKENLAFCKLKEI